VKCGKTGI